MNKDYLDVSNNSLNVAFTIGLDKYVYENRHNPNELNFTDSQCHVLVIPCIYSYENKEYKKNI